MCQKCNIPSISKDPCGHNIVFREGGHRVILAGQRSYTGLEEALFWITFPLFASKVLYNVARYGNPVHCDPTVVVPTGSINKGVVAELSGKQ